MDFDTGWLIADTKATLLSHRLTDALRVYLPLFDTLALMVVKHPHCWNELWHDRDLQVMEGETGEHLDHHWEEFHALEDRVHVAGADLDNHGNDCPHCCEGTTFEFDDMSTVSGRAFCKDRHWVVAHVSIFYGALTLLKLVQYFSTRFLILAHYSGHEKALQATAAGAK